MKSWNCNIVNNTLQNESFDSFIGGKPKLPGNIALPKCGLCGEELTFMFQVAFPETHEWKGKSLAVFFCTKDFHDDFCIPEFPDGDGELEGVEITKDFLNRYERNFRTIVFDTEQGRICEDYQEKLVFKPFDIVTVPEVDEQMDFSIGGEPIWIMGFSERPGMIASQAQIQLLLQIREDYEFEKLTTAQPQKNPYHERKDYILFAANRIYFWAPSKPENTSVYVSVQSP